MGPDVPDEWGAVPVSDDAQQLTNLLQMYGIRRPTRTVG
jgi:hypothetical protein